VRPPRDWGFGGVRTDRLLISGNVSPSDWGFGGVRTDRLLISGNVSPSDWGFGGVLVKADVTVSDRAPSDSEVVEGHRKEPDRVKSQTALRPPP